MTRRGWWTRGLVLAIGAAVALATHPVVIRAQQGSDTADLRKRLDDLEARQKTMEKQLETILSAITAARGDNVQNIELSITDAPIMGAPAAKIAFIEFSDFQCPFCARYTREAYGPLVKEFVESGRVRYVFRHLPLESIHPQALVAAEAAECANAQGKFWAMHDQLFANQGSLMPASLTGYARAIGLDPVKFEACMANPATATRVRADLNQGMRLGLNSTPSFFIGELLPNGNVKLLKKMAGSLPYAQYQSMLQGVLASQSQ